MGDKPVPRSWPIGLLVAWVLLFAIGGGLLGAWNSSVDHCVYNYEVTVDTVYDCNENYGLYQGAAACFAIGAIVKLAFWIILFARCIQIRRARQQPQVVYGTPQQAAEAGAAGKPQYQ
ncbi:hypothetical protein L207DRAFT_625556 [Hyaloscypha variabilis F]|uniref:Uncharacterized protein n=1 Tax=Hyaloscypha variabilis (strain UAMH 11265 / GT02V1 / F) TaxID=1149755 RepID=A0A2J6RQR2_HYAVF|nr:hypothetical protein L207DRAFT_625556 [Hyaloscypha variabilis F]